MERKILQINSVVNTGSTGRIAEDIGDFMISKGWKSYIAYGRYGNKSNSNLIRIGSKLGNYIHVAITRLFDKHGFGSKRATKALIRQIDSINPDIIHLHNIHGYYLNFEILFNYLSTASIPIVWTFHDCWAFTGHCPYFTLIDCSKWKTECNNCPQQKSYPTSLFIDKSKENYYIKKELFNSVQKMTIVPVSKWLNNLTQQSFLSRYPRRVINNGLDLNRFFPRDTSGIVDKYSLNDSFIILGVANPWSERKGFSDFIKLSKELSIDEKIILVGLNKSQIDDLPENIVGIARTESIIELTELYSAADVFVNPTYEDNFPTTNIEALACGTPLITYNTGGSIEAVSESTGFVVEKGDILGLLEYIRKIKEKGKDFYGHNCLTRARDLYNKNDRYMEYYELYNNFLKK